MLRQLLGVFAAFGLGTTAAFAQAQKQPEKPLPVDVQIEADGSAVHLALTDATPPRVGSVIVKRRNLGRIGAQSWQTLADNLGPVMRFTDDTVKPGVAYEYQVLRTARDIVDVGYVTTGVDLPAVETRGTALLLIDETIANDIALRLNRFEQDLIGDGWQVVRHRAPRGDKSDHSKNLERAMALRSWVQEQYFADPFARHALVLIGKIPIALSGRAAPDGHTPVPHATDLFYAEMDGTWRVRVNDRKKALLAENSLPSDAIEMQVGRIDFSVISADDREQELAHLRAYFDKNHHWRHAIMGDLRQAYAKTGHLLVERDGLRNIVGRENLMTGGHHDIGEEQPWLWGADFGDNKGARYATDYALKAAFVINFGSHKQRIERFGNALTATLAQPWHSVAVGWGARPAWRLHHMALGRSIGESHMKTVNNGQATQNYRDSMDYYPTGNYLWRNPVWINLLGDPTLRAFPLAPPRNLQLTRDGQTALLIWHASPDPDTTHYTIYRADTADASFRRISGDTRLTDTRFHDADAPADARYMVKAAGLKTVAAGSFNALSQGIFVSGDNAPPSLERQIEVAPGQSVKLDISSVDPEAGHLEAIIEAPLRGTVSQKEGAWHYTADGEAGQVILRFSVSDEASTEIGHYVINITK